MERLIVLTGFTCALFLQSCFLGDGDALSPLWEGDDPLYVAVGNNSVGSNTTILVSEDGTTWSGNIGPPLAQFPALNTPILKSVIYGKTGLVAIRYRESDSNGNSVLWTDDGFTVNGNIPTGANQMNDICHNGGRYIMAGNNGNGLICASPDGFALSGNLCPSVLPQLNGVA